VTANDKLVVNEVLSLDYSTRAGSLETLPFRLLYTHLPSLLTHPAAAASIHAVLESPLLKAFEGFVNSAGQLCSILQRTCKALQHAATHCKTLQRILEGSVDAVLESPFLKAVDGFVKRARSAVQNILQRTATHCNALQRTATHCNALQRTTTHCNALQHTATHCNALQRTATHRNTIQHPLKGLRRGCQ